MDNLKPCPFCGWSAIMVKSYNSDKTPTYHVECTLGCCKMVPSKTEESAEEKWNRRERDE